MLRITSTMSHVDGSTEKQFTHNKNILDSGQMIDKPNPSQPGASELSAAEFRRRFRMLIFHTWNIPPVFGLSFILLIDVLTPQQLLGILSTPIEPAYIIGWLLFALWFLPRQVRPVALRLEHPTSDTSAALRAVRNFPLQYWSTFLIYLVAAPVSVIYAAETYTDFVARPIDWFRIELISLIVSILVGLPIFFRIFDLFGRALGDVKLTRPVLTIRTKVFLIGALTPLLIDTMLVQYYWTRTGYFTWETFGVWLLLEVLAIAGSLIFAHSFGQSLAPLQRLIDAPRPLPAQNITALKARSTDELGVLTGDYRALVEDLQLHGEILDLNNRILRSAGSETGTAGVLNTVVALCRQAIGADLAFLIVHDAKTNQLVGVSQTDAEYRADGHYRVSLDEPSLAVWAFNHRSTIAVTDALHDARVCQRLRMRFGILSSAATPLKLGDDVLGVLMVAHCKSLWDYSHRDIALLEGLAREAAFALHTQRARDARLRTEAELAHYREHLEDLVKSRTIELETANRELEAFSYSVSHDLRAPLRAINGFSRAVAEDYGDKLDATAKSFLERACKAAEHMGLLIDDLLKLSRVSRIELKKERVDVSAMAQEIIDDLRKSDPNRAVTVDIAPGLTAQADASLLRVALQNFLDNAWKYTRDQPQPHIELSAHTDNDAATFVVRDNGTGFDMQYVNKLFSPFQRLHGAEFPGTGIGLATVQRIIHRHGGRIWAEAALQQGAAFYFTLPR